MLKDSNHMDFSLNYLQALSKSVHFETGYSFNNKDLMNDFSSESSSNSGEWVDDIELENKFNYQEVIHAVYLDINAKLRYFELQAGMRGEFSENIQNKAQSGKYNNLFPSLSISRKIDDHITVFVGSNRRINRPTIKMLNPFAGEYADNLNRHRGNPNLLPEYVNSVEIGNRFVFKKISGMTSVYYRDINQAISRLKTASDDSALFVTYINLDRAKFIGGELSLTYKPFKWWSINSSSNIFYTNLSGEYDNNSVNNSRTGLTANISNNIKLPSEFSFQVSGYFRSKLPSVMGTYKERYYVDMAINRKILKNKAQIAFKVSDVFNSYRFGLYIDAVDPNGFRYSQLNKRKNEVSYS